MKKSELKLMIREIVREEVALSIKEVIREITAPSQNTTQLKQERKENKTNFSSNSMYSGIFRYKFSGFVLAKISGSNLSFLSNTCSTGGPCLLQSTSWLRKIYCIFSSILLSI